MSEMEFPDKSKCFRAESLWIFWMVRRSLWDMFRRVSSSPYFAITAAMRSFVKWYMVKGRGMTMDDAEVEQGGVRAIARMLGYTIICN